MGGCLYPEWHLLAEPAVFGIRRGIPMIRFRNSIRDIGSSLRESLRIIDKHWFPLHSLLLYDEYVSPPSQMKVFTPAFLSFQPYVYSRLEQSQDTDGVLGSVRCLGSGINSVLTGHRFCRESRLFFLVLDRRLILHIFRK